MNSALVLPLVDISDLTSSDFQARLAVAAQLDKASREVGFLYIKGSQLSDVPFNDLIAVAKSYFDQDDDKKMADYIGKSLNHSGYVPVGEEQFGTGTFDLKEAYDINYDYTGPAQRPLLGPNLWPQDDEFKIVVKGYYEKLRTIGNQIFGAFALALGLEEDFFKPHIQNAPSQLRLIHYPFNPNATETAGIGSHTDYECFTLLYPTAEGLQVVDKDGQWVDIPLIENTMVMNIGDMLEVMSNGRYLATKHRVKKVKEERYSFPLFFACDYDYIVEPILVDGEPNYNPISGGEHLFAQTAQTFSYLKKRIAAGELTLSNARSLDSFGPKQSGDLN